MKKLAYFTLAAFSLIAGVLFNASEVSADNFAWGSSYQGSSPRAKNIRTDTTEFNGNLSAADLDVQTALETIDDITISGDVQSTGDCTGGACYDGSSDGGTYVRLYDGDSHYGAFVTANLSGNRTYTFPNFDATMASLAGTETLTNKTMTAAANDIGADTAVALAANGGNCSAGEYPLGVDASGAVESCTDATTEIASLISTHESDVTSVHGLNYANTPAAGDILVRNAGNTAFEDVTMSGDATIDSAGAVVVANDSHTHSASSLVTDSVSADELNATGVEAELEAVLDLSDLQGQISDAQIAAGAVDGGNAGEIADDSITADDLAAGSVGESELIEAMNFVPTGAWDFGGASSLEMKNATSATIDADGEFYLETDQDQIVVQAGSGVAGQIAANQDVAIPLIMQKDITLIEPDLIQTASDAVPIFTIDSYNYPAGIKITAIRLATSASSSASYNIEEWTTPTDGSPSTIDAIATSASSETTETTITDSDIAVGGYVYVDLDTTDIAWAKITIWYYVKD